MGWLYLAGNSLIVARIRQQAGNTGNTAATGQQQCCAVVVMPSSGSSRQSMDYRHVLTQWPNNAGTQNIHFCRLTRIKAGGVPCHKGP